MSTDTIAPETPGQIFYRVFMMRPEFRDEANEHYLRETEEERREWERTALRYDAERGLEAALREMLTAATSCQRTKAGERAAALLLEMDAGRQAFTESDNPAAEAQAVS